MPRPRAPIAEPLAGTPAATKAIVERARETVRAVAPEAEEVACHSRKPSSPSMMWKLFRYVAHGEVVVTIGTFTKHASMFFARGRELGDPQGILEGTGKDLRYITLREPKHAAGARVGAIVREAFALADESAQRRIAGA
jgi:hypothetical protein